VESIEDYMNKNQFIKLNKEKGFNWFDKNTMRFFNSYIMAWDEKTGYFISSEKPPFDHIRRYTIRKANYKTGNVETISDYMQYDSLSKAKTALRKLL
jgi:hypothetical protein